MTQPHGDDEVLTAQEVADLLKVTPQTVARMAKAGRLPGWRLGGKAHWRFRRSEILKGDGDGEG